MSRYMDLEKLKAELAKGKPMPKKEAPKPEPKPEPEMDMDVNDDGKIDAEDIELVKKAARNKKIVKKED